MPRRHRNRYDTLEVPSGPELKAMYLKEGLTEKEASEKAKKLHDYMNSATDKEARFWKKVRAYEETVGLDVAAFIVGDETYA